MAHRAWILHRTSALFALAVGLAGVAVVTFTGLGRLGHDLLVGLPALCITVLREARGQVDRDDAPLGVGLATPGQTHRSALRQGAVPLAGLSAMVLALGLGLPGIGAMLAFLGLGLAIAELVLTVRIGRWEREHPDEFLAQELTWHRSRRFGWREAWGDRTPDGDPQPARTRHPALAATRLWPSRDPEDYR